MIADPRDIPDLRLWLSAEAEPVGAVTTWHDLSGHDHHASNVFGAGGGVTPGISTGPGGSMSFNDNGAYAFPLAVVKPGGVGLAAAELFLSCASTDFGGVIWAGGVGVERSHHPYFDNNFYEAFGSANRPGFSPGIAMGTPHRMHIRATAGAWSVRINESPRYSDSNPGGVQWPADTAQCLIGTGGGPGSTYGFNGSIGCVLIYGRELTPTERAQVDEWLAANMHGGTPATTPPDPPDPEAAYRAVVRIGSHTWDVDAGDPPTYGPTLPLSFGWAVPEDSWGFPAQPDPDLCSLELVTLDATDMSGVDIGTTMRVSLHARGDARPLATFRGRVADLEAAPHAHAPTALSWRVLGIGYTADPSETSVGSGEWPQESGDARAARIMAEAGYPGWSSDAIGTTWEARQPAPVTARAALEDLAAQSVTGTDGGWGPARRVLFHPNTDADGELEAAAPFSGVALVRQTTDIDTITASLVNRRTSWRRTKLLDAKWVKIDHPGGPTVYGDTRGPAYPPLSVQVLDPRELADLVLDTIPGYRWLTGDALRLELHAADTETLATVGGWFYRDPDSEAFPWAGRVVVVENITQTPDASTTYAGMLSAATVVLEPSPVGGRLVVLFRLRPDIPAHSTATMRWADEPAGATWADELAADPNGTWLDYYTRPRP